MKRWSIRTHLAPPVFPGDEDKTRRATLLNSALLTCVVLALCLLAGGLAGGAVPAAVMGVNLVFFAGCLVVRRWTYQGRIGLASGIVVATGLVGITLAVALLGTVRAPATAMYVILVIAAGLLFDLRGLIAMTMLCSLAIAGLIVAANTGWLPRPAPAVAITQWVTYTVLFAWAGSLTFAALQSLRQALARAEQEIAERKQAEEAFRESEEKYRSILEAIEEGYYEIDLAGNFTFFNESVRRFLGYSQEEMLGMNYRHFTDEKNARKLYRAFNVVYRTEVPAQGHDWEIIRKDHTTRYVECSVAPMKNKSGQTIGFRGLIRDITERKRAEEALREGEERLRTLIENVGEGIGLVNPEEQFTFVNSAAEVIFGVPPGGLLGRNLREFATPEQFALIREQTRQRMLNEKSAYEVEISHPDGTKRSLLITAVPQFDGQGQFVGTFGVFRDMTERKQTEQRAFELALERERMALLTKFINDVSHEFRTPLTIMQTNLYLLGRLEDPVKRQRKLAVIGEQVTGITRLVELLVEMARLDSGAPFTLQPTDLNGLIGAVAGKRQAQAAAKGLTLRLDLAPDLPSIPADGNRLGRALHELLDNAVRFTPAGGSVTVRSTGDADGVTVEVQDTGPGIPPGLVSRIFERFYRQDVAHTTPGFGLGLPIARAIIERHGGRLEVESQVGQGTLFYFTLPIAA